MAREIAALLLPVAFAASPRVYVKPLRIVALAVQLNGCALHLHTSAEGSAHESAEPQVVVYRFLVVDRAGRALALLRAPWIAVSHSES